MPRLLAERIPMAHPGDVSGLAGLFASGRLLPREVRAVVGKTEGNGGLNDFTRGYFIQSLMTLLAEHLGEAPAALAARIPCVLSGGTEGVLSPHAVVFGMREAVAEGPGLALGTGFGVAAAPGTQAHIEAVEAAVRATMAGAGIADPALVFVKTPAGSIASMARARAAAALGAARALGDVPREAANEAALLRDLGLFSTRVAVSAGIEVPCDEVLVLGEAPGWAPGLALAVRPMADALDLGAVQQVFRDLGLTAEPAVPEAARGAIRAVFAKGEPDASGRVRGQRHTMLGDTDLDAQRHLRGALGAVVAAVAGDGRVFVSGGAEHQGPAGGGLVAAIVERRA